jgi:hypothetical protein
MSGADDAVICRDRQSLSRMVRPADAVASANSTRLLKIRGHGGRCDARHKACSQS